MSSYNSKLSAVLEILLKKSESLGQIVPAAFSMGQVVGRKTNMFPENLLFHGDNKRVLHTLHLPSWQRHLHRCGGLKLVYVDPPFAVESDFSFVVPLLSCCGKEFFFQSVAYSDKWGEGNDSFFMMLYKRLRLIRSLLADDGACYVHCDWRTSAFTRLLLDKVFGAERFLGEIIWHYTGGGRAKKYFSRKHDTIFYYAKSDAWTFNRDAVRVPYKPSSGYARGGIVSRAGKRYEPSPLGTPVDDVWDIPIVNPMASERLAYPTQKPEKLLERIIAASSNPGDLVADFFCGSGTTLAVAAKMGRRWLGADCGGLALLTAQKRLTDRGDEESFAVIHEERAENDSNLLHAQKQVVCSYSPKSSQVFLHEVNLREFISGMFTRDKKKLAPALWRVSIEEKRVCFRNDEGQEVFAPWETLISSWSIEVPLSNLRKNPLDDQVCVFSQIWSVARKEKKIVTQSPPLPELGAYAKVQVSVMDIFGAVYREVLFLCSVNPD